MNLDGGGGYLVVGPGVLALLPVVEQVLVDGKVPGGHRPVQEQLRRAHGDNLDR